MGSNYTFAYPIHFESLLQRSPARLLKYILSRTPWTFFPYGHYGIGSSWWRGIANKKINVDRVICGSVWGNFCALYALFVSRYAPGMKRRRWDPNLFKIAFEGQLLLEFDPTLRRSKILYGGTGFSFFKWLKTLGEPADQQVYNLFDKKPEQTYINQDGAVFGYQSWNYRYFDPHRMPTKELFWAETYFPNQWRQIGPSMNYYSYPGSKLINRYSIGYHPNGYFIKNYGRYRYNPAGSWGLGYAKPYESVEESLQRVWRELPYVEEQVREVVVPLSTWQLKRQNLPAGSTETHEQKVLVDTRDDSIIKDNAEYRAKYRDDLNALLSDSPQKKSLIDWKRASFSNARYGGGGATVIDPAQYPDLPPEIYFSINYANGLFQHLPKRIKNEPAGDPVYFTLGPPFRK